ncbi:zinc-dependent alcohol dehydrogenase [Novosphingobium sp.]|uniref:zinc-dependent alcohol dehydrogenase n=1 Tax=Novosphingobium sp. TaxID=1874826 RepID=UPI0038BD8852
MKAITWHGKHDVRCETVDDPEILNPRDAIVRITSTAICGSDLHLYDGFVPTMQKGDILGHEFMGEVVEVGGRSTLKPGQRVVVPFTIACGGCYHCGKHQYSACDNGNPADNQDIGREMMGQVIGGLFGYSHMGGGYSGGQAEYVRVPFSDVGPLVIPDDSIDDEKVLFLTDILPTGWMAAENAGIEPGDTVAVWGCGPVGLFAVQSAFLMGAERVIAIDHFPHRLALAAGFGAETINFEQSKVYEALEDMTGGIGPDATIDCVGLEAHGAFADNILDQIKVSSFLGTDRAHVIRQAILATRKGGRASMPGVYAGFVDKFPLGAFMEKGLSLRTGQTHVQRYLRPLYTAIAEGRIDSTFLISHRMPLSEGPVGYRKFHDEQDVYTKIVLKPGA